MEIMRTQRDDRKSDAQEPTSTLTSCGLQDRTAAKLGLVHGFVTYTGNIRIEWRCAQVVVVEHSLFEDKGHGATPGWNNDHRRIAGVSRQLCERH